MKQALGLALRRLLMKHATVTANEQIGENYRRLTFEGQALTGVDWVPGQKLQIAMGEGFVTRTYTPVEWDAKAGRAAIVGYAHGGGPGSTWLRDIQPGNECDILGPRASINTRAISEPLVLFGDETSIGLAGAIVRQDRDRFCQCHFEVDDRTSAEDVLTGLGIAGAALFKRTASDHHLGEMEAALAALAKTPASFVLTGKAGTIQRFRQTLRRHGVPARRVITKAYWAPGKVGLD